jgi:hypothetical protein
VDFLPGNEELPLEEIKSWAQRVNTTSDCDVQQKVEIEVMVEEGEYIT